MSATDLQVSWQELDDRVRSWWDGDLAQASERDAAADPTQTLLPLPHRYVTAGGSAGSFPEMYGWDTHFINLGLLAHGRDDLVTGHVRNQLDLIDRYQMVLNGNRSYYLTRSQPPLLADSVSRLLAVRADPELATAAAVGLASEYRGYWSAEHHATGTGLATNRDLGDPRLGAELAAEAETGLDFTAVFAGDVRRCVPLITNACLTRTARVIATLTGEQGWSEEADRRAELVNRLCWDDAAGLYLEYDVVAGRRLPFCSLATWWPVWAGIATDHQVDRMVESLDRFRASYGLAFTDDVHPSPHPQLPHVQWNRPNGWAPAHLWVCEALVRYGHHDLARSIARDFLSGVIMVWQSTGQLWEKYDVERGGTDLPLERYPSVPMHGWTSAAVAVLGRLAFGYTPDPGLEVPVP